MDDVKAVVPMRYDIATDEMVPVTQEWVHQVSRFLQSFGNLREAARRNQEASEAFLASWQPKFEQKS